jgi:hypothetical protein
LRRGTDGHLPIDNDDFSSFVECHATARPVSLTFDVGDITNRGGKMPLVRLFDYTMHMIDALNTNVRAFKCRDLKSVMLGHYTQAMNICKGIVQLAPLFGCFSQFELVTIKRWLGWKKDLKKGCVFTMARQTGKTTMMYALMAMVVLYSTIDSSDLFDTTMKPNNIELFIIHETVDNAKDLLKEVAKFIETYAEKSPAAGEFIKAEIRQTQDILQYDFGDRSVTIEAIPIKRARGRTPHCIFLDEVCNQQSTLVEDVLAPIIDEGVLNARTLKAFRSLIGTSTPNPFSGPFTRAMLVGDTRLSRHWPNGTVCDKCIRSTDEMCRCRHLLCNMKPWEITSHIDKDEVGKSREMTLIGYRGCTWTIMSSGLQPDVVDSMYRKVEVVRFVGSPPELYDTLPEFLYLHIGIDPDFCTTRSLVGYTAIAVIMPQNGGSQPRLLILCSTSIPSTLQPSQKAAAVETLTDTILTAYKVPCRALSRVTLSVESNSALWAAAVYKYAVNKACAAHKLPLHVAFKPNTSSHSKQAAPGLNIDNLLKMSMMETTQGMLGDERISLVSPYFSFVHYSDGDVGWEQQTVTQTHPLLTQLKALQFNETRDGMTYSGKSRDGRNADDIAISMLECVHLVAAQVAAIDPSIQYYEYKETCAPPTLT